MNQGLALIACAFSKFSNKTNNRLRTSSNTRNQAVVQDGRVEIQNRNYGRLGSGGYIGNSGNGQRFNATGGYRNNAGAPQKRVEIVETGNTMVRCYNCNGKGHLANVYPKQRTWGNAFHKQSLLLALKDEAGGILTDKENNFMADEYSDDDMEDLEANAAVMLMANMQELHMSDTCPMYDTDGLSQVPGSTICLIHEIASPSASTSDEEQVVQNDSLLSPQEDEQMNTVVTFDDDDQINPVVTFYDPNNDYNNDQIEQNKHMPGPDPELMTLLLTTQTQAQKCNEIHKTLKAKIASLTADLECCKIQLTNFETQEK